jgi:hypothetical protein
MNKNVYVNHQIKCSQHISGITFVCSKSKYLKENNLKVLRSMKPKGSKQDGRNKLRSPLTNGFIK